MAGHTLRLLVLCSLLILTEPFEVREDEWEELGPDIAALHRLTGLSQHMSHQRLEGPTDQRDTTMHGARVQRSSSRVDIGQNPMSLQDELQDCESFTACVIGMEQEIETFLAAIDKQKTGDWLLGAAEVSHRYSHKLLVITDKDKSTSDRVQQEYSLDPHYSVVVSKECLYNKSCVPETDHYTVVKIFGSLSDDGQTVSGLSGPALAELMLNSALEAAPVFSLDGNTTTDFQHNFIRALTVRGSKAVLETLKDNQQIYQVMDQPDTVSKYQIPQRPVDHTTQYDHQHILIMENDPVVRKAATSLYEKHQSTSTLYVLDENHSPKLIHGDPVPLSEESRLVLVGHGARDSSGEMRLSGYRAEEVATIIQKTSRFNDKIKTTSVVACEVGSDDAFVKTLTRELHDRAHIETELHLRNTLIQVTHTGQKITQEISRDGLQWKHKDDSTKVVTTVDRKGDVIIRKEQGSKGEVVFTNERNFLMERSYQRKSNNWPEKHFKSRWPEERFKSRWPEERFKTSWPDEPRRFVNPDIFEKIDQNNIKAVEGAYRELEAMSWGLFHSDRPAPKKIKVNSKPIEGDYLIEINPELTWIVDRTIEDILPKCYEINSAEDITNVIRHYGKTGEERATYLMINDWIYAVDPKSVYMYLVGKRLDNNEKQNPAKQIEVKEAITGQFGKEQYREMREKIPHSERENYVKYVRDIFHGEYTKSPQISTEAWFTTYFTASVIAESARNFRTFPLILMGLDMIGPGDNVRNEVLKFFFEDHPMARGGSWIDPSSRGFTGSATPEGSIKLGKHKYHTKEVHTSDKLMNSLITVGIKEYDMFKKWKASCTKDVAAQMAEITQHYKIFGDNKKNKFLNQYQHFKKKTERLPLTPSKGKEIRSTSGTLGGFDDGHVTMKDLTSASAWERTFKHESYFSRTSASFAEQIHGQLKSKYGVNLRLMEGSARIENGQFICQLVSDAADSKLVEARVDLSPESQRYNEKLLKSIETAAHDMEHHTSVATHQHKSLERIGTAVGTIGLMLGMKGTVRAFENGDIEHGVMGALQTAHGVTAMTTAVIAKQALSSETRIAKAATSVMRSPAMKSTMTAIPIFGIGFGIYNFVDDLKRNNTLGNIDAALDGVMVGLDVIELVQPELAPIIAPVTLALSVVRMVIDDLYMGIQEEIKKLPKNAGVLDKLAAGLVGFEKGVLHFEMNVLSFFYDYPYEEIEHGRRLVEQISDYHNYYKVTKQQNGTSVIDFTSGSSSWNGGDIDFCLADEGPSTLCMDRFVSADKSSENRCWKIDTERTNDIILGLGESSQLEYTTKQITILLFIPVGSVKVVSGYKANSNSRYGTYRGNRNPNRFIAVQKPEDKHQHDVIDFMLSYYYSLYGEPGNDMFFLGPQRSYVEGSGGQDTYLVPENGGKTVINNFDLSKAQDTLHFSVDYSHISVSKSGVDVVLMYEDTHTVTIRNWFLGEEYRHMNMVSGDGVFFDISSIVVSSVRLVAKGINKNFMTQGQTVDTSEPPLDTVTSIFGSQHDDKLIGNREKNQIDGAGGRDQLIGGEEEDVYVVKSRHGSLVSIENYSTDNLIDQVIIEANLHSFHVKVDNKNVILDISHDHTRFRVILVNWFRSPADRHLFIVTKDLISFTVSDNKADCLLKDPFAKCIRSQSIDYSKSTSPLMLDLQEDKALESVTEVRGSNLSDVLKGNQGHNVLIPGPGDDFIQGRGGEDWYVITPGQGVKTINNESPDTVVDFLFLKAQYQQITSMCEGQNINIFVNTSRNIVLQDWFVSNSYQHLQIKTSDGVTAGLMSNPHSCTERLIFPITVDYRNQKPEPLSQSSSIHANELSRCYRYRNKHSEERRLCGLRGKVMEMSEDDTVKEMYGSSGFDIMVGNGNDNVLDPYTEGALMFGDEGKDTYIIKHQYGSNTIIDNFAEDLHTDTVLVDMDFIDGSKVTVDSPSTDVDVTITSKGEQFKVSLLNYKKSYQHQHLEFQSSDGVLFKVKPLNSTRNAPFFQIEAFKVILKQSQVDCRMDLSSHRNLSKVHTVQGCWSQSNNVLGNDQDNALIGGQKDDALEGGEGADTLIGGSGADILIGGTGDDTLYGEDGNDTMMGNSGSDVFIPGPGADLVDGGPGRDTVVYRGDHGKGKGVYVNLLTGQGRYADAEGDVLKDVETVIGTIYSDILVSGYESSLLQGSDGNDMLVSTGGDYLVGGDGSDIYMLAFHNNSVTIDNCAKDNATDVLYFSSHAAPVLDCQHGPDAVFLRFFGLGRSTVSVALRGWISDAHECGHLLVVFRGAKVSVDRLLQGCELRQEEGFWSDVISWVTCISLVLFHFVVMSHTCRKQRRAQQQKAQAFTAEVDSTVDADVCSEISP